MTITWINCAERMPHDDKNTVIFMRRDGRVNTSTGAYMNKHNFIFFLAGIKWTPFTEEAWSELNKVQ